MRVNQPTLMDTLKAPLRAVSEGAWVVLLRVCVFVRGVLPWA